MRRSQRSAPRTVRVDQWSSGEKTRRRLLFGPQPRHEAMLVLIQASSMKTRRYGPAQGRRGFFAGRVFLVRRSEPLWPISAVEMRGGHRSGFVAVDLSEVERLCLRESPSLPETAPNPFENLRTRSRDQVVDTRPDPENGSISISGYRCRRGLHLRVAVLACTRPTAAR